MSGQEIAPEREIIFIDVDLDSFGEMPTSWEHLPEHLQVSLKRARREFGRIATPKELSGVLDAYQYTIMALDRKTKSEIFEENRRITEQQHENDIHARLLYCERCKTPFPIGQKLDEQICPNTI